MTHPLGPILLSDPRAIAAASLDCLIVGSGTSGATAAIELANQGRRVAILEAGPLVLPEHVGSSPFANREDIVPEIHNLVRYDTLWTSSAGEAAARDGSAEPNNNAWSVVGGRTLFWGGCTPRFLDDDFDDWPYDADEMRPWYTRAEALIGVSGGNDHWNLPPFMRHAAQEQMIARLGEHGMPAINARLGVDTGSTRGGHISMGFDSSISRLLRSHHLGRIENGAKISLAADTQVVKLVMDAGRVGAVTVRESASGESFDIPARHVFLAGGALQSTRLAMVSGLGDGDPLIGRFIGDHLFRQAVFKLPEPIGEKSLYIFVPPTRERPFHVQLQGMFRETWYNPLYATVWLDGDETGQYMLFYTFAVSKAEREGRLVPRGDRLRDYYVVNDRSPGDLKTLAEMNDFTVEMAQALGAELVRTQENGPGAALHEFGGLRMGRDPTSSVTDPDGRFWRVANLSCVDAAIWPRRATPTPT